jgi:hypothetical protein
MVFFKPAWGLRERPLGPVENFLLERGAMLAHFLVPVHQHCKIFRADPALLEAAYCGAFIGVHVEHCI